MPRFLIKYTLFTLCLFLLSACASTQAVEKKRYFWPPLPGEPKIEWIGNYSSNTDLRTEGPSLFNIIVGETDTIGLQRPMAIAADSKGRVIVTDNESMTTYIFDFNQQIVNQLGDDSLAGVVRHLTGVAVDGLDNIYISDASSRKIHVVSPDNRLLKVLDLSKQMSHIGKFTIDKIRNKLILPDLRENKIVVTDLDGNLLFSFGKRGDADGEFNQPQGVAVEKDGTIVVADSFNARIQRFTPMGQFINKFGRRGDAPGDFAIIKGVAVDSEDHIYVTDGKLNNFSIFSNKGDFLLTIGGTFASNVGAKMAIGGFLVPQAISIDQNDRIYIVDQLNRRFQVYQYINDQYRTRLPVQTSPRVAK